MPLTTETIQQLRDLEAKATDAPWALAAPDAFPHHCSGNVGESTITILGASGYGVLSVPWSTSSGHLRDINLSIAARNALPGLLALADEVIRLRAERERLVALARSVRDFVPTCHSEQQEARDLLRELEAT